MKITVIHNAMRDETPTAVALVHIPTNPKSGIIDIEDALEYAYRWTNNVMGSWSIKKEFFDDGEPNGDFNPNVKVMAPLHEGGMGLRSTSVGDQMLVGNKKYVVASFGFKTLDGEQV